jgi:hypothetical protein
VVTRDPGPNRLAALTRVALAMALSLALLKAAKPIDIEALIG